MIAMSMHTTAFRFTDGGMGIVVGRQMADKSLLDSIPKFTG
jgi:hypothetical protein